MNGLSVALGGALGALARYGVNLAATRMPGMAFPFGTLFVNILGCLVMGAVVGIFAARETVDPALKLFLTTGLLGGFTTFSAFSIESVMLYERRPALAVAYVSLSVILALGACALGLRMARAL